jgi:hypothetical protein
VDCSPLRDQPAHRSDSYKALTVQTSRRHSAQTGWLRRPSDIGISETSLRNSRHHPRAPRHPRLEDHFSKTIGIHDVLQGKVGGLTASCSTRGPGGAPRECVCGCHCRLCLGGQCVYLGGLDLTRLLRVAQ